MGVTSETGTVYPSGTHEVFMWFVVLNQILSFLCSIVFTIVCSLFVFPSLHCVVCPLSMYGF